MKTTLAIFAFVALALSAAATTADAQYYYQPYGYYYDGPPPPRVVVRPRRERYFDDYSNYYPARRGFEDYNPAVRGNLRGCSVDLGYGRYESCDKR